MSNWTIVIPDDFDRMVRTHIAQHGGIAGDLSEFVSRAVQKEVFRQTVKDIQDRNADADEEAEILRLVNEAVDWARADRS